MLKRFFNSPAGLKFLGQLLGWYARFCGATTRWTYVGRDVAEDAWAKGGPVIVCFWHNRMLLIRRGWEPWRAPQRLRMLASHSRDGEVISEAARAVGFDTIRGSSAKPGKSKGVFAAFREMLSYLAKGQAVGVTPDGPRGPRGRVQMGAIQLAARTGAPIVCFAWSKKGRALMRSWDRHLVPYPFGGGVLIWAGPLRVPKGADEATLEASRLELEALLHRITDEADRRVGVETIAPEPARVPEAAKADEDA